MPKFVKATDVSARTLDIYNKVSEKVNKTNTLNVPEKSIILKIKTNRGSVFNNLKNRFNSFNEKFSDCSQKQ